ncbi:MAG: hypothetical protein RLZZ609_291 [Cyanobacteriota bacterium]|jgi:hypothetical protein
MHASKLSVYQIYFAPEQLAGIDSRFIPYDNSASPRPDEHEFYVFQKEYHSGRTQDGFHGYLSWKFREKTGIGGAEFLDFCMMNPGYDVYFINPFPIEICFGNIWEQGEMWLPGMSRLAQELFDHCGYTINLSQMPRRLSTTAFCNFWVGSPKFWDQYMDFCLPLYNFLLTNPQHSLAKAVLDPADPGRKASYFAFIFERLFTTLLNFTSGISYAAYTFSRRELARRYPDCYANFLTELQQYETRHPNDPQPLLSQPKFVQFLNRQQRAIQIANKPKWRRTFNKGWNGWTQSNLRRKMLERPAWKYLDGKLFYLLNPGYVHWRRDLPKQEDSPPIDSNPAAPMDR